MKSRATKILTVLALSAVVAGLASYKLIDRLLFYNQFKPLLSSAKLAEHVDWVSTAHPGYAFICSWLGYGIMTVKLSENKTEKYLVVPMSEWSKVLDKFASQNIVLVAVD